MSLPNSILINASFAIAVAVIILIAVGSDVVAFSCPHRKLAPSSSSSSSPSSLSSSVRQERSAIIRCYMADCIHGDDDGADVDFDGNNAKYLSTQSLPSSPSPSSRRNVLVQLATVPFAATATTAMAAEEPQEGTPIVDATINANTDTDNTNSNTNSNSNKVHISANWKSVDGLNSNDTKFVAFENSAYAAMRDDKQRTPYFEKAIINRLNDPKLAPNGPESQTVLDLGTGPYALFAILAAKNGAGKVYAIEANPSAAAVARETVKKLGYDDVITILEGFSTDITLPNKDKVDFVVAEIIGSVASEEGAFATIADAHERLVKDPMNANNWIPSRVQTFAAPASYTLHNLFKPPAFDWGKLSGEPVRFNCRDEGLQLLADPLIVEDISFADINANKGGVLGGESSWKKDMTFVVDRNRIDENASAFYKEFRNARLSKNESEELARDTSQSFSGIALWPRLLLDGGGTVEVNSRAYPNGGHQKSHWQTVLPIMSDLPVVVKGGDEVCMNVNFDITRDVLRPPTYSLDGNVTQK